MTGLTWTLIYLCMPYVHCYVINSKVLTATIELGESFELSCAGDTSGIQRIQWFWSKNERSGSMLIARWEGSADESRGMSSWAGRVSMEAGTGTLAFHQAEKRDQGYYACFYDTELADPDKPSSRPSLAGTTTNVTITGRLDYCQPSPCQHGGTCHNTYSSRPTVTCTCTQGYKGTYCEHSIQVEQVLLTEYQSSRRPALVIAPNPANIGSSIQLTCESNMMAVEDQILMFSFFKSSSPLQSDSSNGMVFTVKTKNDSGQYFCAVRSKTGPSIMSGTVELYITDTPSSLSLKMSFTPVSIYLEESFTEKFTDLHNDRARYLVQSLQAELTKTLIKHLDYFQGVNITLLRDDYGKTVVDLNVLSLVNISDFNPNAVALVVEDSIDTAVRGGYIAGYQLYMSEFEPTVVRETKLGHPPPPQKYVFTRASFTLMLLYSANFTDHSSYDAFRLITAVEAELSVTLGEYIAGFQFVNILNLRNLDNNTAVDFRIASLTAEISIDSSVLQKEVTEALTVSTGDGRVGGYDVDMSSVVISMPRLDLQDDDRAEADEVTAAVLTKSVTIFCVAGVASTVIFLITVASVLFSCHNEREHLDKVLGSQSSVASGYRKKNKQHLV